VCITLLKYSSIIFFLVMKEKIIVYNVTYKNKWGSYQFLHNEGAHLVIRKKKKNCFNNDE